MATLRKAVGLPTVIATSTGLALATVSLTANVQIGQNLPGASGWLAVVAAGLISVLASWCFAELVGIFPTAAGIKLFIEKAFGEKAALLCATLYVGITVLIVGSESYILASVLHYALPAVPQAVFVFGFLALMTVVNLRGITFSGITQDVTTYVMIALILVLSAWALWRPGAPPVTDAFALGSGFSTAQAVALGVFLYLGFEWVTPLAEEVTDFHLIPRGMLWSLVILAVVYALLHIGMMTAVPKAELASSPIPHVLFGQAALGRVGMLAMAAVSALASVTSFNAGLMTASRFLYAMARDNAAPPALAKLHPDWATPWAAILTLFGLCSVMAGFVLGTGHYKLFIFLGAAIECMIFVAMAASVLKLRRTMPHLVREFKVPGGTVVPWLVAVLYALLFVLVFVPDPAHPGDAPAQMGALLAFVIAALAVGAYVQWLVPWLRARAAPPPGQAKRRRRPGAGA
ncbi:MAG TPA: APC family permease [Symbiobacteriaceae bacterium]|jgi:amino acid transporter|nr:APC family permease [Symbiobacteriaceae bacterium]